VINKHIDLWLNEKGQQTMQPLARDLNMETSQDVFVGPYLDKASRQLFSDCYWQMCEGFLCFPLALPGTTLWKAIKAREKLVDMLAGVVRSSRQSTKSGKSPECLLDVWMESEIASNEFLPEADVALHILDFLFASQDATTSAIVWIMVVLAERADIRKRLQAEQDRLRPNNEPITYEMLEQMEQTFMFVKEVLRWRPPATMVPHKTLADTQLTDDYVVPKGTVVLPSIWCACHEGFPDPEKFDMDRFSPEKDPQDKFAKHFLVFGHGPHMCIGRHYAMNYLITFTAMAVKSISWERQRTQESDEIVFLPTIFPKDKMLLQMQKRTPA